MDENITKQDFDNNRSSNRFLAGIFLIGYGILLLLYKMNYPIPHYFFEWPAIAVIIGLYVGIKSRFHNSAWIFAVIIGGIFLFGDITHNTELHDYIIPLILISLGAIYIARPKRRRARRNDCFDWRNKSQNFSNMHETTSSNADDSEYLEINAVFGGGKKMVLSKNFAGGEINCFMGGAEINFLQADVQRPVKLEVNNVFGGTKIIVPSNWDVKNQVTTVFGGFDDKRNFTNVIPDANKRLIIEGNCFFGGIEIRNF